MFEILSNPSNWIIWNGIIQTIWMGIWLYTLETKVTKEDTFKVIGKPYSNKDLMRRD